MMRKIRVSIFASLFLFGFNSPVWAELANQSDPLLGDFASWERESGVPLGEMQAAQGEEQAELQRRVSLLAAVTQVQQSTNLEFAQVPTYSQRIPSNGDFVAQVRLDNPGTTVRQGYLLVAFTPPGTTDTTEIYRPLPNLVPGANVADLRITNRQLLAAGIRPGRYVVTFAAFDESDRRIGGSGHGFYGLAFTFGTIDVHLPGAPTLPNQIGRNDPLPIQFSTTNKGDSSDLFTALFVFTPPGSQNPADSIEVYVGGLKANPGETAHQVEFTAEQLRQRGIQPGRWLVTTSGFNGLDQRVETHPGWLLTIGNLQVGLPTPPTIPLGIKRFDDLETQFTFTNTGDTADRATALLVFTPPGSTDPSQSREIYITGHTVPPGGATHQVNIPAAQLAKAGITPGLWLVTASGFDGRGTRLESYYGHLLTIGDIAATFSAIPSHTSSLRPGEPFRSTWELGNDTDGPVRVLLVIGITPLGNPDPLATKEFSKNVEVPVGGGVFEFEISGEALAQAGIKEKDYGVGFLALDAAGKRIGPGFFGNRLSIGEAQPSVAQAPIFSSRIDVEQDFTAQWRVENSGPVSADVTFLTVFRRVGTDPADPRNFIEISRRGTVPAGGGEINALISASDREKAGIPAGEYVLTFVLFDNANDHRIGRSFGNLLAIGLAVPGLNSLPGYRAELVEGSDFVSVWDFSNTGSITSQVTQVVAITFPGTNRTVEFSQEVRVPPGGGSFEFRIPSAQLSEAGFGPGFYTASFVAVDGQGDRLNQFFGNRLEILEAGTPVAFLSSQQVTAAGPTSGLLESWRVPAEDPLGRILSDRAFVYDQAISAMASLSAGQADRAREVLQSLERLEAGTGKLLFTYATGPQGEDFPAVFTGTNAWVIFALMNYEDETGDGRFRPMAERMAAALSSFQDPTTGLFRIGLNADGEPFSGISTEHNLGMFLALGALAAVTKDPRHIGELRALSRAINTHLWAGDHFRNGFQDDLVVLDVQALGGIYWDIVGDTAQAETVLNFIESRFRKTVNINGTLVTGYAPFHADSFIWAEGSALVAFLNILLDRKETGLAILNQLEQLRDVSGGLRYSSSTERTRTPGSDTLFPAFPNVAATSWALIAHSELDDPAK